MPGFFERLFGNVPSTSAKTAKERLQLVLIHDRTDISPATLEQLKDEIIGLVSRHVDIDRDGVEFNLTQTARESRLVANIPLAAAPSGGRKRRR